ncbi:MAG TPA: ShlB/FhaC/HecB family hemolysin secretion/activation protein [Burkholderiales bacterium]
MPGFLEEKPLPFVLPPAPAVPEGRLTAPIRLVVTRFRFAGATAFPEAELQALVAPFTGRPIGNEELEEARLAVTRHYLVAGYLFSGAVIPDQAIGDGTVLIQVVEGRVTAIEVGGANNFAPDFIRSRVTPGAGPPLNVLRLQERMQLLLQNPQIERINSELGAGAQPGDAVLRMDVAEAKRRTIGVSVANNRSPAVGGTRRELNGSLRNEFGHGESFGLRVGEAKGLRDTTATLALPVSPQDTLLTVKLEHTESHVVEPPFDQIDIRNDSDAIEVGLVHPLHKSVPREVDVGATLVHRRNASTLLGQPFSFVPGQPDGKSVLTAMRLATDWSERSAAQVLAAHLAWTYGLPTLGATKSTTGDPDSRYSTWLAQVQGARRLPGDLGQLVARFDGQKASDALLPSEKFALGGSGSVRGYRENALVRDNGWASSIEYRKEVGKLAPLPEREGGPVEFAVFGDIGAARDHRGEPTQLSSVGIGVRWMPWRGALAQVYKAHGFDKLQTPTETPQDRGVHFLFQLAWDF